MMDSTEDANFEEELVFDHLYISKGIEQPLIILLLCGLVIFLLCQIYKCVKVVLDPYDAMDKETWTDNLEKGNLQSFM